MSFVEQAKSYLIKIDKATSKVQLLTKFEQSTGLPRSYAVVAAGAFYFLAIFFNAGGFGELLLNLAGFVVPGYYSLIALNTKTSTDDTQLLTYWVVFAFLNVIEFWTNTILYWFPFYFLIKTIFLLYIGIPSFGGANVVYNAFIKPLSQKYVGTKDSFASRVDSVSEGVSSSVKHK